MFRHSAAGPCKAADTNALVAPLGARGKARSPRRPARTAPAARWRASRQLTPGRFAVAGIAAGERPADRVPRLRICIRLVAKDLVRLPPERALRQLYLHAGQDHTVVACQQFPGEGRFGRTPPWRARFRGGDTVRRKGPHRRIDRSAKCRPLTAKSPTRSASKPHRRCSANRRAQGRRTTGASRHPGAPRSRPQGRVREPPSARQRVRRDRHDD